MKPRHWQITKVLTLFVLHLSIMPSLAQVPVCTDPFSCNYFDTTGLVEGVDYIVSPEVCLEPIPGCYECTGNNNDGMGILELVDFNGNGVCDLFEIDGCTSITACNYNPVATQSDNSCIEPYEDCIVCTDNGSFIFIDSDLDGVCNANELFGCTDITACNYNPAATEEDASCVEPLANCLECDGLGGQIIVDSDNDGICDFYEVAGCSDISACNFQQNATDDDGSCVYAVDGCSTCIGGQIAVVDTDNDGICDLDDDCPFFPFLSVGDPCDDGNENTSNDFIDENCQCIGDSGSICDDSFPAPAEETLETQVTTGSVEFSWEAVEGQVGCQIQFWSQNEESRIKKNLVGETIDNFVVPISLFTLDLQYAWRVCCACSVEPIIGGPFTSWQPFLISGNADINPITLSSGPNPVHDLSVVTLSNQSQKEQFVDLSLVDLTGKVVRKVYSGLVDGYSTLQFKEALGDLSEGIYLYRAVSQESIEVEKIFVHRR